MSGDLVRRTTGRLALNQMLENLSCRSDLLLQHLVRVDGGTDVDDLLLGHGREFALDAPQQILGWVQVLHERR